MTNPEFSRPVRIDTVGDGPQAMSISASEDERAALADRFGLIGIARISADAQLRRTGEAILVSGRLRAAVTQACVASGDPVAARIDEPFELRFVPVGAIASGASAEEGLELGEVDLDVVEYEGSAIDVGEAVAQTLALALDPFPRSPAADAALRDAGVMNEDATGPFAGLKALRDRLK